MLQLKGFFPLKALSQMLQLKGCFPLKSLLQMLQLEGFFPLKALWQMLQLGLLSFKSSVENVTIKWLFC